MKYKIGTRLRTNVRDEDTGPRGGTRLIRKGTVGTIASHSGTLYDIAWANGGWTRWTAREIRRDATVLGET